VIGSEAVDDVHVVPQRSAVLLGSHHGTNFGALLAEELSVLIRQEQVVRANFASHGQALKSGQNSIKNVRDAVFVITNFERDCRPTFSLAARIIWISSLRATWQTWTGRLCSVANSRTAAVVWLSAWTHNG